MPVEQVVDHTPAWLAFVGAVIVALLAAGTATWRQRVEMRHDGTCTTWGSCVRYLTSARR